MAGLSVLLEPHSKSHPRKAAAAQIISKATLVIHGPTHKQQVPVSPTAAGSFLQLQRCCLCSRELAEGMDIYMYRGDRAFCSEECRCRQIFMDEDAGSGAGAAPVRVAYRTPDAVRTSPWKYLTAHPRGTHASRAQQK